MGRRGDRIERYDFSVIESYCVARWPTETTHAAPSSTRYSMVQDAPTAMLARVLGVDRTVIWRARHDGLSASTADRMAVALGYHPLVFWPDWMPVCAVCFAALRAGRCPECPTSSAKWMVAS